jgi:hypothetical protein
MDLKTVGVTLFAQMPPNLYDTDLLNKKFSIYETK